VRKLTAVLGVILMGMPRILCAAEVGDPGRGLVYAKKVCAVCHAVEAGDKFSPTMMAPTFDAVAGTPGMNERALVVWLQSSDHGSMPNLMLASEDRDDVVAYIMSLRAQK